TIILQLANHALSELLGQPNTVIPSSSSQPLVPAGSNLEEICLKQVNNYSFCWRSHYSFVSIGHLNFIFFSGTGVSGQQPILLPNRSYFSGRGRRNIIGQSHCTVG